MCPIWSVSCHSARRAACAATRTRHPGQTPFQPPPFQAAFVPTAGAPPPSAHKDLSAVRCAGRSDPKRSRYHHSAVATCAKIPRMLHRSPSHFHPFRPPPVPRRSCSRSARLHRSVSSPRTPSTRSERRQSSRNQALISTSPLTASQLRETRYSRPRFPPTARRNLPVRSTPSQAWRFAHPAKFIST